MKRLLVAATAVLLFVPASVDAAKHVPGCNTEACDKRMVAKCKASRSCSARVERKKKMRVAGPYWGIFEAIASCESGGNWAISTGNGFYGGIQFTLQSWHGVGGTGYPHQNSKLEQIYRGVLLQRAQGWGAWPHCRHAAGV